MIEMPAPLPGITIQTIETPRLRQNVYFSGPENGVPVVFVHGNCASALHWEETMLALPAVFRGIAPDLRGYGWSEAKPADATAGLRDYAEDIHELLQVLGVGTIHLVGHSMGGGIAMQYALMYPGELITLTLADTVSPFGFGGTSTVDGKPTYADYAGSGGGTVNQMFVMYIQEEDRTSGDPTKPRDVINSSYYKPPFKSGREEDVLSSLLSIQTGDDFYPGDMVPSANWPFVAPGTRGVANAFAPKYVNLAGIANLDPKPPILWIQARDDLIVSDFSFFDFGALGKLGLVPGYPGEDVYAPQPMVGQTRYVLEQYRANGGTYREEWIEECGHVCYINQPEIFQKLLFDFIRENG